MVIKQNMKRVAYYISLHQIKKLKTLSRKTSISVSGLIRLAINDYLDKSNEK